MNRTFDEMTGDWLKLQRSYWESLGLTTPAAANDSRSTPWWSFNAPPAETSPAHALFGLVMDQAKLYTQLGSLFTQAGQPDSTTFNEQLKDSVYRAFQSFKAPLNGAGLLNELWTMPFEQWRKMTSLPQGLAYALKPFTTAFSAEQLTPVRYEQLMGVLSVPGFGPMREYQDEHQSLIKSWLELQKTQATYQELFLALPSMICEELAVRLDTLATSGKAIESLQDFYALFVDAAEARYAELVNTDTHTERYGQAVNALMSFRRQLLDVSDRMQGALNLPTRRELDGLHQNLRELSRQNRRLQAQLTSMRTQKNGASANGAPPKAAAPPRARPKAKPAPRSTPVSTRKPSRGGRSK